MQQPPNDNQPTYTPTQPTYTQYPPQFAPPPPQGYPSYPPPYMRAGPPPKKRRIWLWIVGAIIALIVISSAFSKPTTQTTSSTPPAATAIPTTPPLPTLIPTEAPTQPLAWTTVQTFKGNGNKKTGNFDVPDSWRIAWSCTPSSSFGGEYNVIVDVNNSDGTPLDIGAINTICAKGNTADSTEEHAGGTVYLDVTSEGAWTIKVQVLK